VEADFGALSLVLVGVGGQLGKEGALGWGVVVLGLVDEI
jgi:hypothetical protein